MCGGGEGGYCSPSGTRLKHVEDGVVHLDQHSQVDGQAGLAVLRGGRARQPGEGVVLLQYKPEFEKRLFWRALSFSFFFKPFVQKCQLSSSSNLHASRSSFPSLLINCQELTLIKNFNWIHYNLASLSVFLKINQFKQLGFSLEMKWLSHLSFHFHFHFNCGFRRRERK